MEDHRLKAFCLVVELKSFSKAAEAKHITQSAISQIIRGLEEELEVKLLNRDGKNLNLTPAGRIFYQHAKDILTRYTSIDNDISALTGHLHGQLVVVTIPTLAHHLLPPVVDEFSKDHPNVEFSIMLGNSDDAVLAVNQGLSDIGLFEGSVQKMPYKAKKIARDEMVLVVSPDNAVADKGRIAPSDLEDLSFIMPEVGSSIRELTDKHLASLGLPVDRARIAITVNDPAMRLHFAASGLGAAFVSHWSAHQLLQEGKLVVLKSGRKRNIREYYLATHSTARSPLVDQFVRSIERYSSTIQIPETEL
ncbi:MAG TPA: LysR family transcriptional regulator [Dissulfurispiraceae bacterium]|nr:LysR family transcriptional regulator [Dissulfurispiraceae bacterium]